MINILVLIFQLYLFTGLIFSIAFIIKGAVVIDKEVLQSPKTFRVLLIPGAILLWPVLFTKWLKA